jgi:hypothetical protein
MQVMQYRLSDCNISEGYVNIEYLPSAIHNTVTYADAHTSCIIYRFIKHYPDYTN